MVWEPSSPSKCHDESEQKFIGGYKTLETLGEGSFATVKRCEKDGQFYAMKILRKLRLKKRRDYVRGPEGKMVVETAWDKVQNEIKILKTLESPHVVQLKAILDFEHKVYLIFDIIEGGVSMDWCYDDKSYYVPNTRDLIPEPMARVYIRDVLRGLEYLHGKRVAHRDIKPQNIFVDKGHAKIGDLGTASLLDENDMIIKPGTDGTHCFFPPEYCSCEERDGGAPVQFTGVKVDVWCVGVCLHAFLFGKLPFYMDVLHELFEMINEAAVPELPEFDDVSEMCRTFQLMLLRKNPSERPDTKSLLEDPFLAEADTDEK
eukprot:GEMP01020714.1.p1 GENE.GEMP01020714.1~~GEMP01020714.1.p1  ORF type:complete len:317 (+),score=66.28 GEMP01020714.1:68-1018(+)